MTHHLRTPGVGRTNRHTSCAVRALGGTEKGHGGTSDARRGPNGTQDAGHPQAFRRRRPSDTGTQPIRRRRVTGATEADPSGKRGASRPRRSRSPTSPPVPRRPATITPEPATVPTGACPVRTATDSRTRRPCERPSAHSVPEGSVRRRRSCRSLDLGSPSDLV